MIHTDWDALFGNAVVTDCLTAAMTVALELGKLGGALVALTGLQKLTLELPGQYAHTGPDRAIDAR